MQPVAHVPGSAVTFTVVTAVMEPRLTTIAYGPRAVIRKNALAIPLASVVIGVEAIPGTWTEPVMPGGPDTSAQRRLAVPWP